MLFRIAIEGAWIPHCVQAYATSHASVARGSPFFARRLRGLNQQISS